jgi:hypothetical protein
VASPPSKSTTAPRKRATSSVDDGAAKAKKPKKGPSNEEEEEKKGKKGKKGKKTSV